MSALPPGAHLALRPNLHSHQAVRVARQLWNVPCTAHRSTDGLPCEAWSMRGSYVCRCHGGATIAARGMAEVRLAREKFYRAVAAGMAKALAQERAMTPQQRQARHGAIPDEAEAMLPPPKPRHPPLCDPETGVSWSLERH
jgi:hypothetical protein